MKITKLIVVCVLPLMIASTALAYTDVSVGIEVNSVNEFYEPLSSQGYWVEVGSYGRCWHPTYVSASWRPYSSGTWVWTDYGWYWQSDEPWGWACYHYGRWAYDPYYGWVWVPDTVWGPAWVVFRGGGGYCGWAPLPPGRVMVSAEVVPATWFVFVGVHHFGEPVRPRTVIVNNTTIINKTTIINNTRTVNNTVINAGPRVETLQKVSRAPIRRATVKELSQRERVPPSLRRAPQEQLQREPRAGNGKKNVRPETVAPVPERRRNNPPEIIRGGDSVPDRQAPKLERRERVEPPGRDRDLPPRGARPKQVEERPSGPPSVPPGEKVAPPPREKAPPPEGEKGRREKRGHDKDQGDEDKRKGD